MPEASLFVASIAVGLVFGPATTTEGERTTLCKNRPFLADKAASAFYQERPVLHRLDLSHGLFFLLDLSNIGLAQIVLLRVGKSAGRAFIYGFHDLFGAGTFEFYPRALFGVENIGKALYALGGVYALLWVPPNRDLVVGVLFHMTPQDRIASTPNRARISPHMRDPMSKPKWC